MTAVLALSVLVPRRSTIFGALRLYLLNFVNLFQFLIMFLVQRR